MAQKQKLQKPKYRIMLAVLDQCARKNVNKAVFAILLYAIIQSLIFSISMVPMLLAEEGSGIQISEQNLQMPSTPTIAITLILAFIAAVLIIMMNYGLFVIMARMVEKKYVTIGYLFSGFTDRPRIMKASMLYAVILSFGTIICAALIAVFQPQAQAFITNKGLTTAVELLALVYLLLLVILLLPFVFVWMLLYTDKNLTPLKAFSISIRLRFGHVFHFIGVIFASGGINLLIAIGLSVAVYAIPTDASSPLQVLSVFLSMIAFVTEYIAMVRMYLAVPIYFFSLTGVMHVHSGTDEQPMEPEVKEITDSSNSSEPQDSNIPADENKDDPK